MRKCYICNGDVESKKIDVQREWEGKKILIQDVPAEVCEQCGENYFDSATTLRMEQIKKASIYPQEQEIVIPTFVRKFDRYDQV